MGDKIKVFDSNDREDDKTRRFVVRHGKFGAYFYDQDVRRDMTLEAVEDELNSRYEQCLRFIRRGEG
jgi:hypothetical protein